MPLSRYSSLKKKKRKILTSFPQSDSEDIQRLREANDGLNFTWSTTDLGPKLYHFDDNSSGIEVASNTRSTALDAFCLQVKQIDYKQVK